MNTPNDLHIRNSIDGEEMMHLALTKKSVYILISSFLVISFFLVSLLFLFTPIKYYIPGYETNASRKKLVALNAQISELASKQENYEKLVQNIRAVALDNEEILLDTLSMDRRQLSAAEMANALKIETDAGKQYVIGKKPIDTIQKSEPKTKNVTSLVETELAIEQPVAKPKKRDTIITYK